MPLNRRGSVSARFSVWFSRSSTRAESGQVGVEDLYASHVDAARALSPWTTCSDARFFVPASVNPACRLEN